MEPLRFGLIGYGVIGKSHCKAVQTVPEAAQIVAVADLLEPNRQQAAADGAEKVYASDEELLADPRIEAVTVAVPTGLRDAIVLKALKRGKHVLFEKPPAMNAATIERFMALRGRLTAACGSGRVTFAPSVAAISRCVADGVLGPLRLVRIHVNKAAGKSPQKPPPPWRQSFCLNGGGILVNWGIYDLNYMMELTNWQLKPVSVMAQWWPVAGVYADRAADCSDADSHFVALIRCAGGEAIVFERGEFMPIHGQEQWQIVGGEGTLTMKMGGGKDKAVLWDQASAAEGVVSKTLWQGDDEFNGMAAQYVDFAQAVATGRAPRANLEQCLTMQRIFDAVYESARCGRSVQVGA